MSEILEQKQEVKTRSSGSEGGHWYSEEGLVTAVPSADGKVKKFLKENTLWNQDFVKNPKESVGQHIQSIDKEAQVVAYKRFSLND